MLALTDDEKERVATENNGSGLGEGGEGQHKGCIGPRTYQVGSAMILFTHARNKSILTRSSQPNLNPRWRRRC